MKHTVCVVMSSYNGEKYIGDQIESIIKQSDVDVTLYIRDDGSKDGTRSVIEEYQKQYNSIILEKGKNIGFQNSFIEALKHAPVSEYYAFSDQDDIWIHNKLIETIKQIESELQPALAFCNAEEADENMNILGSLYSSRKELPCRNMTLLAPVGHGFLMVMNSNLRDLICKNQEQIIIPHDLWVGAIASYTGIVKYVPLSLAYHRRLVNSVSKKKYFKELRHRIKAMLFDVSNTPVCCEMIKKNYISNMDESQKQDFLLLYMYRRNINAKIKLLKDPQMRYEGKLGGIVIKLKILLNRF